MEDFDAFYIGVIATPIILLLILFFIIQLRKKNKKKSYLTLWNVSLTAFFITMLFAGLETYYRFMVDTTDSFGVNKITKRWFSRHYKFNNAGFRDNIDYNVAKDPSKKCRVTFLGDSFTAGHGVKSVEDRFANIIRKKEPDIELHVLCQNGNDTKDHLDKFFNSNAINYQFEYIVLCYCLNDISYLMPDNANALQKLDRETKREMGYWHHSSYFINTMYFRLKGKDNSYFNNYYSYVKRGYSGQEWEWQKENLKFLASNIEKVGAKLIVVTFPFFNAIDNNYIYAKEHRQLDSLWKSVNVPHLDLFPFYKDYKPNELVVNKYDAHPNELAHSIAAEKIQEFIAANISCEKK